MSKLITGKEARLALAQGNDVDYFNTREPFDRLGWCDANDLDGWAFSKPDYRFRLKPKTITINNIEVPAPFKPKDGDTVFIPANFLEQGYIECKYPTFGDHCYQLGAWRTEDEIKQVVEAMRKPFKEA